MTFALHQSTYGQHNFAIIQSETGTDHGAHGRVGETGRINNRIDDSNPREWYTMGEYDLCGKATVDNYSSRLSQNLADQGAGDRVIGKFKQVGTVDDDRIGNAQ